MTFFSEARKPNAAPAIDVIPPESPATFRRAAPRLDSRIAVDAEFCDLGPVASDPDEERYAEVRRSFRSGALGKHAFVTAPEPSLMPRAFDLARRGLREGSRLAFWTSVLVLSAASFWTAGGHALAERLSKAPPLTISAVETRILDSDNGAVLVVEGWVKNATSRARDMPFLVLETDRGGGRVMVDTGRQRLEPGESVSFTGRLAMRSDEPDTNLRISFLEEKRVARLAH